VAFSAVRAARAEGIRAGLLRPITLNPLPIPQLEELAGRAQSILVTEMNSGQMLDDVLRVTKGRLPVEFYGRMGGVVPFPDEILGEIRRMAKAPIKLASDPRKLWIERMVNMTKGMLPQSSMPQGNMPQGILPQGILPQGKN
jgi:2-oxoglutarate ferredoxin oxidoreductase subunit alpha